jgi:hypothetical protein
VYDRTVNRTAVEILKKALALPGEERAALAACSTALKLR